jgi:hypothetical protein
MTVGSDPGGVLADTLVKDSPSEDSHISIPILVTYSRTVPSSRITASGLTPSGPIESISASRVQSLTKELLILEIIFVEDDSTFSSMTTLVAFAGVLVGSESVVVESNGFTTEVTLVAFGVCVPSTLLSCVRTS